MDLSHLVARRPNTALSMCMNFLPGHEAQVRSLVQSHRHEPVPLAVIPGSSLPPRLCAFILEQCRLTPESTLAEISEAQLKKLMDWITAFPVQVSGVRGFDTCQVSAGGVPRGRSGPRHDAVTARAGSLSGRRNPGRGRPVRRLQPAVRLQQWCHSRHGNGQK